MDWFEAIIWDDRLIYSDHVTKCGVSSIAVESRDARENKTEQAEGLALVSELDKSISRHAIAAPACWTLQ